ncbi:MAG: hypothetical protein QM770_16045 [Tepidisphaeraceae bacterium]
MRIGSSVILGLAIDDRGVTCAELSTQGSKQSSRKLGRFVFSSPLTAFTDAAGTGTALKAFLQSHGFTARKVVVGVPSKWLISAERDVPTASTTDVLAMLRLQGESLALANGNELVVDLTADPATLAGKRVLLVAMLKEQLDRLITLIEAAGLDLEAITSTAIATHTLLAGDAPDGTMLMIAEGGTDVVANSGGAARLLRHVSAANASTAAGAVQLSSDLRRTVTLAGLSPLSTDRPLLVWNGVGLGEPDLAALGERAGIPVRSANGLTRIDVRPEALNGAARGMTADAFLPAIAVACVGLSPKRVSVDLAHSRLAPPKQARFGRGLIYGVVGGVVAIAGIAWLYETVSDREAYSASLAETIKKVAPDVKAAEATIDRIAYGRTYFEHRPPILEAMREVTIAFNYNEPIWATNFTLRDNRTGVLQGKANSQGLVLALLDRLKANPKLRDVKLIDVREGGGRSREQTFSISFTYAATE